MPVADSAQFEARIVSQTETYLDQVEACVTEVPRLLEAYADRGPYRQTADRIAEAESDCDRTQREIGGLIANADATDLGIRLTRLHLNSGPTIELYQLLDEIANAAERFAEELVAIGPQRSLACLDRLREMAECAARTVPHLRRAVAEFVRVLCDPGRTGSVVEEVTRIRAAESDCDRTRNDLLAAAFDGATTEPLVYREFALLLDGLVDTMEDVTDQLLLITGNQSWIAIEPERDRPA
ncbi:MAG: DUF47 domain-containing protein [Haloarculaceae archaeon]